MHLSSPSTAARRTALAGIGLAVAASGFIAPSVAHASTARNGVCESGEFCLSFNSGFTGSISDFASGENIYNLGAYQPTCYEFKSRGNGQGQCVKNNAAAARNLTSHSVTLWTRSGYQGVGQVIAPGQTVTLKQGIKNNEASLFFSSGVNTCNPRSGRMCPQ